jgi:hypothetical protein
MAETLTGNEPGFFSEIQESPSLFLTPGSTQVVGLLGEGKATKTVNQTGITRGTDKSDLLSGAIYSISLASSNAVYRYPQSSYAIAHKGVSFSATGIDTKTLKVTVDGSAEETFTMTAAETTASLVATKVNATALRVKAEATADAKLLLYAYGTGMDGKSFTIGAGTANTNLGYTSGDRAMSVRWDPAVVDSEFAPQAGEVYQVNYESPKVAADYAPKQFFSLRQVVAEYGDVTAANTLSLGAAGAFGNGASIVTCRQLDPAQMDTAVHAASEIIAALSDLEDYDVSILVPMVALNEKISTTPIGIDIEYLNHVSKMSSKLERRERTCILGMNEIAGRLDILGVTDTWQSYMTTLQPPLGSGLAPKRVMVVNPGRCLTSSKGVSIEADGTYAAACLAGRMVSSEFDEAEPMTRKTLATVTELILPELSRPEKNQLTALGVIVVEAKSSLIMVRRSITADGSSIASQEPSIVRAFDRVANDLRESLENRFVGTKIINTTHTALEAATSRFLETLVNDEIIGSYKPETIKAEQNKNEPRQFDISFEAVPVFPFIWGFIDISITLS